MKSTQQNPHDVLAEARRFATPRDADRARATQALEALLGAEVVARVAPNGAAPPSEGSGPASRGVTPGAAAASSAKRALVLRPGSALSAGIALVGLGVAIGYGIGAGAPSLRDTPSVASPDPLAPGPLRSGSDPAPPVSEPPAAVPSAVLRPQNTLPSQASEPPAAARPPAAAGVARSGAAALPNPPAPAQLRRPPRGATHTAPAVSLTLREVLMRLQRAHAALEQGRAALALIELAEIDRSGSDLLREEREVTRVLALCASGDTEGARAAARALSAGPDSIYARRLESSCAGAPTRR